MKVSTLNYTKEKGWSAPFPELDSPQTLIMVFASPEYLSSPNPIKELKEKYPKSKIVGCSTAGNISGSRLIDKSLSVAISQFEKTQLKIFEQMITESTVGSYDAGVNIFKNLIAPNLRAIFILSDGINVNASELVDGLNKHTDKKVVITGAFAADDKNFKKTWTIYDGALQSNQIIAIGFYGENFQVGSSSQTTGNGFGPERRVTRSKKNVLYELDGQSALTLYKQYLGDIAKDLPASGLLFPLTIWERTTPGSQQILTVISIDENEKSVTLSGNIPQGYSAQLVRSKFDDLIFSAVDVGTATLAQLSKENSDLALPILSIAISCVSRRALLGERTEEETESVLKKFPEQTQQVGFYSYGSVSAQGSKNCVLHNQSISLTTFYER